MSKGKRRRSGKQRRRTPPASRQKERSPEERSPAQAPPRRRRWFVIGGAVAVIALGLLARVALRDLGGGGVEFPPPLPQARDTSASYDDFVGSDECEECHKPEYDVWKASTHGNAGGVPGAVRIIAPFDGTPIRFRDGVVTPVTLDDGKLAFRVEEEGEREQQFEVAGVVGGGHMFGGGTQAFFAEFPDGTFRFLPFDFIRQEGVWFCQTAGRSDQGWAPITPEMTLSDCNDWPPVRVLGADKRFANCQQCHGSQILLSYAVDRKRYDTRFTTLAINCESCHGPGRRHIEIAESDSIAAMMDIGAEALATLDKDGSLQVCFQCHAVKAQLRPGYISGRPLEESFSDLLLLLSYRPYFPDGRIRLFAYQQQHLYSDCYLNGSMTCVDCHDPHSQTYRDIWWQPLVGRFSDGQCLDCHASKMEEKLVPGSVVRDTLWAIDLAAVRGEENQEPRNGAEQEILINAHTYHPVSSLGGRCTDCHMPYLQEPDVGNVLRYSRSDHTIPIPRPEMDALFGIENACVKCHRGRSFEEVQAKVKEWYGELKPPKALIKGLIDARGVRDRVQAARLMLLTEDDYVALQFTNLSYFMLSYLTVDMPELEDEIVERLKQLAAGEDPDLKALALASLHFARGQERAIRSYLAEQLRALGPRDGAIRRRWAWVLDFRGNTYTGRDEPAAALATYRKAAEILPDDPEVLRNLGNAHANVGDYAAATRLYRRSLEIDAEQPITLASLAVALATQGDFDGARTVYGDAIELNPHEPTTYLSLGNTLLRGQNVDRAIDAFQQAVSLDPSLAEAHFALARVYYRLDMYEQALEAIQLGLKFDRANRGAREMLTTLRAQLSEPSP